MAILETTCVDHARGRASPDAVDVERAARTRPPAIDASGVRRSGVDERLWLLHVRFERLRTRELRALLVEQYTPHAHSLARRAHHHREPLDDLRQVAVLALIGALERFECERSIPFAGFATPTIVGCLKRYHRDHDWAMRIPRDAHTVATGLAAAEARLDARPGRIPITRTDLAAALDMDEASLAQAQAALRGRRTVSLDAPLVHDRTASVEIETSDPGFDRVEARIDLAEALAGLAPRHREVVVQHFFNHLSQREIGLLIGVSQMQVSRLLRSALEELQVRMATDERTGRRRSRPTLHSAAS